MQFKYVSLYQCRSNSTSLRVCHVSWTSLLHVSNYCMALEIQFTIYGIYEFAFMTSKLSVIRNYNLKVLNYNNKKANKMKEQIRQINARNTDSFALFCKLYSTI